MEFWLVKTLIEKNSSGSVDPRPRHGWGQALMHNCKDQQR